ncbi:hypothetical protein G6O67_002282 [Ophiocordyceps sinensis]|uniref:Uncharacterized protein n=2 Tax=Ophiocordyceps sinensis TaxID=72228 RepID=A0A8H4V750_9HYPO|nr:hypothetical protein OCS_03724 [Ophiocordyceps sinensis CO18]KAF4510394.1 hypothetical protein G6O67_002282 [Ophiocordyceps sinensis]
MARFGSMYPCACLPSSPRISNDNNPPPFALHDPSSARPLPPLFVLCCVSVRVSSKLLSLSLFSPLLTLAQSPFSLGDRPLFLVPTESIPRPSRPPRRPSLATRAPQRLFQSDFSNSLASNLFAPALSTTLTC